MYTDEERASAIAAAKASGCYSLTGMNMSPEKVQAFWDNAKANHNENATQAADISDTDLGLAQDIVDLSNGQSSNSTEKTPLPEAAKSDDPHTQEILDELDRLRVSISNDIKDQTSEIKGALAGVEVEINGGASRVVSETRDVKNAVKGLGNSMYSKLSGLENAINTGNGAAGGYAAQAHTDAENISNALGALAKAVNGSGSVQNVEVSVNGSSAEPPKSTDIEGLDRIACEVSGDRANRTRKHLAEAWKWGVQFLGLPGKNPFQDIEDYHKGFSKPLLVPCLDDFWKLAQSCDFLDQVLLRTYYYTAARADELVRIVWDDVRFDENLIRLSSRKGRSGQWRYHWLRIPDELTLDLKKLRLQSGFGRPADRVFCDPDEGVPIKDYDHWMLRRCSAAEVPYFGFKGIRHLVAVELYRAGHPVAEIQRRL
ncbi:MAG: site-specific integrase, partial [Verrucomicrobiae bacterium]|nr:site-specific integrase [Verrucomicrobiae bacterium]